MLLKFLNMCPVCRKKVEYGLSPQKNATVAYLTLLLCFYDLSPRLGSKYQQCAVAVGRLLIVILSSWLFSMALFLDSWKVVIKVTAFLYVLLQLMPYTYPKEDKGNYIRRERGGPRLDTSLPSVFGDSCNTKISYFLQVNRCFLRYQVLTGRIENDELSWWNILKRSK